jgi:hypothetical protein
MLTALYCRGLVLLALSSQPCAHGLGSWSYSSDLILHVIFFQSYSSGIYLLALHSASRRLGSHAIFGLAWSHVL